MDKGRDGRPMYWATHDNMAEIIKESDKAWQKGEGHRIKSITDRNWIGRPELIVPNNPEKTWNNVKAACRLDWKEGLDIIQEMIYEIDRESWNLPMPKDRRRRKQYIPDTGDDVDVDRLRAGQDYWEQSIRQIVPGPQYLTLMANITSSGYRNAASDILWRGACAITLADMLEKVGYRVEIWAIDCCGHAYTQGIDSFIAVKLKAAEDPLDVSTLANGMSGWFYRAILGFQAMHCAPNGMGFTGNYGGPIEITNEWANKLAGEGSKAILVDEIWDMKAALAGVRTIINRMNDGSINQEGLVRTYDRYGNYGGVAP